ncbi:MAG: hypothetical protein ABII79_10845 [bacterium]
MPQLKKRIYLTCIIADSTFLLLTYILISIYEYRSLSTPESSEARSSIRLTVCVQPVADIGSHLQIDLWWSANGSSCNDTIGSHKG